MSVLTLKRKLSGRTLPGRPEMAARRAMFSGASATHKLPRTIEFEGPQALRVRKD